MAALLVTMSKMAVVSFSRVRGLDGAVVCEHREIPRIRHAGAAWSSAAITTLLRRLRPFPGGPLESAAMLFAVEEVGVDAERNLARGVAELARDEGDVRPTRDQEAGERVRGVVNFDTSKRDVAWRQRTAMTNVSWRLRSVRRSLSCGIRVAVPLVRDESAGAKDRSGQAEGPVLGVASTPWRRRAIRPPAKSRRNRAPITMLAQVQ
jgi:hypothetical protein